MDYLLLDYIDAINFQYRDIRTTLYLKKWKRLFKHILSNHNTADTISIFDEIYVQEWDLDKYGIYEINFNISNILDAINSKQLEPSIETIETNKVSSFIYHNQEISIIKGHLYQSQLLITDFPTNICLYTMINENHTFEQKRENNELVTVLYIPFYTLKRNYYTDNLSYALHTFMNEIYILFHFCKDDPKKQRYLMRKTNANLINKELSR